MLILTHSTPVTPVLVSVEVPLLVQSVTNLREHHHVKAKRVAHERETVTAYLWRHAGRATGPALAQRPRLLVSFTRRASRLLDTDNLIAGCKAPRDAVAAWLGLDDGDLRVSWGYDQQTHKSYRLTPSLLVEVRAE